MSALNIHKPGVDVTCIGVS